MVMADDMVGSENEKDSDEERRRQESKRQTEGKEDEGLRLVSSPKSSCII